MSKAKPWNPSADDLRALTEHLHYEVQMTFHLAVWLVHSQGTMLNQTARNADFSSMTLASRVSTLRVQRNMGLSCFRSRWSRRIS
jgi:hypothetical protein